MKKLQLKEAFVKKNIWKNLPLLCIVIAIAGSIADGRQLYLSPAGVDTAGRGTMAGSPWKTISYATNQMQVGDTLLLAAGTYIAETKITVNKGGSASVPMVIKAQTATRPVIDLGYIRPPADLPIADSTDTLARPPAGQAARLGAEDWNRTISIQVDNVILDGLIIQGAHTGIWAGWGTNLQVRNCTIRYNEQYALKLDSYNNVRMDNCNVYHCGLINWPRGTSGWPHSIIGWNASHVVVSGSRVHNNHGEGIGPFQGCSFWEVRNCEVFDNWSVNIYIDLDSTNAIVDGNLTYNTGKYGTTGRNMPDGIRISNEIADMDYSAYGTPQDPTPQVTNVTVTNNICINTGGGICSYSYGPYNRFSLKNSLIANNTIVRIPSGQSGIWVNGDSVKVVNNLIVSCPSPTYLTNVGAGVNAYNNETTNDGGFVSGLGFGAEGYKLLVTSYAVDKGVTIGEVTFDYWGTSRPQGSGYDIGAFEYSSSDPTSVDAGGPRLIRSTVSTTTAAPFAYYNLRGQKVAVSAKKTQHTQGIAGKGVLITVGANGAKGSVKILNAAR